jgi:hypothetical protein
VNVTRVSGVQAGATGRGPIAGLKTWRELRVSTRPSPDGSFASYVLLEESGTTRPLYARSL